MRGHGRGNGHMQRDYTHGFSLAVAPGRPAKGRPARGRGPAGRRATGLAEDLPCNADRGTGPADAASTAVVAANAVAAGAAPGS